MGRPFKRKGLGPARAASGDQADSKTKPTNKNPKDTFSGPSPLPTQKGDKKMEGDTLRAGGGQGREGAGSRNPGD